MSLFDNKKIIEKDLIVIETGEQVKCTIDRLFTGKIAVYPSSIWGKPQFYKLFATEAEFWEKFKLAEDEKVTINQ